MKNDIYVSPVVGGPELNAANGSGCTVGQNCSTGFGAIVIIGGAVVVAVAVYCPPAVVVATFA
jgi:hypothetical protein